MNKIKFLKNNLILVAGVLYTPYLIGNIPQSFGFITNEEKQAGTSEWFNLGGLTYMIKKLYR